MSDFFRDLDRLERNEAPGERSAATTQCGGVLARAEPVKMAKRAPRAPAYSRLSGWRMPRCESSPASNERWTARGSAGAVPTSTCSERATWRSCPYRSWHSRTRR